MYGQPTVLFAQYQRSPGDTVDSTDPHINADVDDSTECHMELDAHSHPGPDEPVGHAVTLADPNAHLDTHPDAQPFPVKHGDAILHAHHLDHFHLVSRRCR